MGFVDGKYWKAEVGKKYGNVKPRLSKDFMTREEAIAAVEALIADRGFRMAESTSAIKGVEWFDETRRVARVYDIRGPHPAETLWAFDGVKRSKMPERKPGEGPYRGYLIVFYGMDRWGVEKDGDKMGSLKSSAEECKRYIDSILGDTLKGTPARRPSLGAAPGDVDGFVRETTDAVDVHAERAFERAGLTVAGKPLGARAWTQLFVGELGTDANADDLMLSPDRGEQTIVAWTGKDYIRRGTGDASRLLRYAWFARQFVRGATGLHAMDPDGYELTADFDAHPDNFDLPEARLGLDLWRLGRNVVGEVETQALARARERRGRVPGDAFNNDRGNLLTLILDSVRTRLNWPRLPADYDPPPPSKWPEAD